MKSFPFYKQHDTMDCGPACLQIVSKYYGKYYALQSLRDITDMSRSGVSLNSLGEAATILGFSVTPIKASFATLQEEANLPFIVHWNQNHFIVVYKISGYRVYVADPATGLTSYRRADFLRNWASCQEAGDNLGVALLLEPTASFSARKEDPKTSLDFRYFLRYFSQHRQSFVFLIIGLLITGFVNLIFPILFQTVVDNGIKGRDFNLIYLILAGQVVLYLSVASVDFVKSWTLLHVNFNIIRSIQLNFLDKLMRLVISFFESKRIGDIVQRFFDQQKIQFFLTGTALTTIFSVFNFLMLSVMIVTYNGAIFMIFILGSAIYMGWILAFLKRRKRLDYLRFESSAKNQTYLYQLISGMPDIKLNNAQAKKMNQWETLQRETYKLNMENLQLTQYQQGGAVVVTQIKNVVITCLSATAVIKGEMSLGVMMAIQFVIGQLNGPIEQLVEFIQTGQDALIAISRMNEIYSFAEEPLNEAGSKRSIPHTRDIVLKRVTFKYPGKGGVYALEDLNASIPIGKTTAIVGMSGTGKTTLLKLLMRYYVPTNGSIMIGGQSSESINLFYWRSKCGVVLQDGYIFPDTIKNNIVVTGEEVMESCLEKAISVSNIADFVNSLPAKLNTKIGSEGTGLSQGQKQRILIARAVYKDPDFIFLDEATNSLDSNNESIITDNLKLFFKGRTVIMAAHRLSTVKNASLILVMHNGRIVEQGTHEELLMTGRHYYKLFKTQFEIDV